MKAKVYIKTESGEAIELEAYVVWYANSVLAINFGSIEPNVNSDYIKELTLKQISGSTQETDGAAASTPTSSSETGKNALS